MKFDEGIEKNLVDIVITNCLPAAIKTLGKHNITREAWNLLGERVCAKATARLFELAFLDASYETVQAELARLAEEVTFAEIFVNPKPPIT